MLEGGQLSTVSCYENRGRSYAELARPGPTTKESSPIPASSSPLTQLTLAALLSAASAYLILVPSSPPLALDSPSSSSNRLISAQEVSKHNSADSCWVIVHDPVSGRNKVWDLTDFLELHPGGEDILIAWSGKDAS